MQVDCYFGIILCCHIAAHAFSLHKAIKLEKIDDILVVHRNQNDTQRKNHASLIKVWDEKVIPLIEGTHGKEE